MEILEVTKAAIDRSTIEGRNAPRGTSGKENGQRSLKIRVLCDAKSNGLRVQSNRIRIPERRSEWQRSISKAIKGGTFPERQKHMSLQIESAFTNLTINGMKKKKSKESAFKHQAG